MSKKYAKHSLDDSEKTILGVNGPGSGHLDHLTQTEQKLLELMDKPMDELPPLIVREGKGVIWPNTFNCIQGKTGAHKSRLVETFCGVLLGGQNLLGFRKYNQKQHFNLLYIDTERNIKYQLPYALKNIRMLSGKTGVIPGFHPTSLIQVPREKRFDAVKEFITYYQKPSENHTVIVIDVIPDVVIDFNDPGESQLFIDHVNENINQQNVTYIFVIHENPSQIQNKARGHLGTLLTEKCSTSFQIAFETDKNNKKTTNLKLEYKKIRSGPVPEPIYIYYNNDKKRLEISDDDMILEEKPDKSLKATLQEVADYLGAVLTKPENKATITRMIMTQFSVAKNTAIKRIDELAEHKITIQDQQGNPCFIHIQKEGNKAIINLITESGIISQEQPELDENEENLPF